MEGRGGRMRKVEERERGREGKWRGGGVVG